MQIYNGRKVEFDVIAEIDMEGDLFSKWSTWDHLEYLKQFHNPCSLDRPSNKKIKNKAIADSIYGGDFDYYHMNSIQELPKTKLGEMDNRFQEGNSLICLRNVDLIVILDQNRKKIVWRYGVGELERPQSKNRIIIKEQQLG